MRKTKLLQQFAKCKKPNKMTMNSYLSFGFPLNVHLVITRTVCVALSNLFSCCYLLNESLSRKMVNFNKLNQRRISFSNKIEENSSNKLKVSA